jgi:hypothetical protein
MRRDDSVIDEKYVVYPRGDNEAVPDRTYFVLRHTDLFGHAVLWLYLSLIQTQLELARVRPGALSEAEVEHLEGMEIYVRELATEWQRAGRGRLPT